MKPNKVTEVLGFVPQSVVAIALFTIAFSFLMFSGLKAVGRLRVDPEADRIGIDAYEHGASVWPDVYAIEEQEKNRTQTSGVNAFERE